MKLVTFILFAAITFVSAQTSSQPKKAIDTGGAGPRNPQGSSQSSTNLQNGLSANRFERKGKLFQQNEDKDFEEDFNVPEDSDESDDDDDDCMPCVDCESSEEQEPSTEPELPPDGTKGELSTQLPAPPVIIAM